MDCRVLFTRWLQLSSPSRFVLLTQKCGSYVIDSAKGDGRGGGAEVAKMERTGGQRESLFYMLQPLHYAVEETALFPSTPGRHERESRTRRRQLIAFVVEKISACVNYFEGDALLIVILNDCDGRERTACSLIPHGSS